MKREYIKVSNEDKRVLVEKTRGITVEFDGKRFSLGLDNFDNLTLRTDETLIIEPYASCNSASNNIIIRSKSSF